MLYMPRPWLDNSKLYLAPMASCRLPQDPPSLPVGLTHYISTIRRVYPTIEA